MMKKKEILFYHDLIDCIITALEVRDPYTANHSRRVSDMCEQLCRVLEIPQTEAETIHMAAHVHDIGKIGIPDSILDKPGRLEEWEWQAIREHPRIGAHILEKSRGLAEVSYIVLCHHERWDGKGYPNGLKGEEIPLGARVIAICDSVDAMMSRRAYREALTSERCRGEIIINSGSMYDPKIVPRLVDHWSQVVEQIQFP